MLLHILGQRIRKQRKKRLLTQSDLHPPQRARLARAPLQVLLRALMRGLSARMRTSSLGGSRCPRWRRSHRKPRGR